MNFLRARSSLISNVSSLTNYGIRFPGISIGRLPLLAGSRSNFGYSAIRSVHKTEKKDHTSLITSESKHVAFHKMSLNALKNECRSRGIRVSGRKAELVDRITSHEGSSTRSSSTNSLKEAPPKKQSTKRSIHTSKVINTRVPDEVVPKLMSETVKTSETVGTRSIQQDPVGLQYTPTSVDEIQKIYANAIKSQTATNTKATSEPDLNNAIAAEIENSQNSLNSRDRVLLLSFATAVGIWWSMQYWEDRDR